MTDIISSDHNLTRREALYWVAAVAASLSLPGCSANPVGPTGVTATGYGNDPDLVSPPGQPWPRVLDEKQLAGVSRLIDLILPAAGDSPSGLEVGLVGFFEEWLAAPYPLQEADRKLLEPLIAQASAGKPISEIAHGPEWERFRLLTASAYFTTPVGMREMGFVGNVPRASFDGPPEAVLKLLDARYAGLS